MSNATKHTPGPWETSKDAVPPGHVQVTVYATTGLRVATAFESDANANLIAAAPDLLAELKHALGDAKARLYVMPVHVKDIERAILNAQIERYESAIRKAEGL